MINFDLPPELKNGTSGGRDCSVGPGEEVELGDLRIIEMMLGKMMVEVVTVMTDDDVDDGAGADGDDADRPCLPSLAVLEVEGSDEVIVAPNMLRHKVNLEGIIIIIIIYYIIIYYIINIIIINIIIIISLSSLSLTCSDTR